MTLNVGTVLNNRYRIERVLAKGGMGAVYRATDLSLNADVAIKENLFTSDPSSHQFFLEAKMMASLRHPNLPRVSDYFILDEQGQYLIMDYIEGEDLKERISNKGKISLEEGMDIASAICDVLTYLHRHQPAIIHRDIKPENIKINPKNHIYLVDFGLAKQVRPGEVTELGARAATPGFAPPEQYGHGTDSRSDLYALGATLYAALTSEIPEDALSRITLNAPLTPIRQYNPDVPKTIALVIEKALQIAPDDRHQSAEEFKQALMDAMREDEMLQINDGMGSITSNTRMNDEGELPFSVAASLETVTEIDHSKNERYPVSETRPKIDSKRSIIPLVIGAVIGIVILCILIAVGAFFVYSQNFRQ